MSRAARAFIAALALAASSPAAAQENGGRGEAEALFRDANQRFHDGDYPAALALYQRAYERLPSPRILVNMATTLRALGRHPEAADVYTRVLAAPAADVSPASRAETESLLRQLDIELGRLRVLVAVDGAHVKVDDRDVGVTPLAAPVHVTPGEHSVSVEREGFRTATSRAVVSATEIVDVSVVLVEIPPPPVEPAPMEPVDPESDDGSIAGTWWFWTGLAVVVAGVAAGGIFIASSD